MGEKYCQDSNGIFFQLRLGDMDILPGEQCYIGVVCEILKTKKMEKNVTVGIST